LARLGLARLGWMSLVVIQSTACQRGTRLFVLTR
jgi:hypothetical protein